MIETNTTNVETFQVLDSILTPPPGTSTLAYVESGLTQIPLGSSAISVVFQLAKTAAYVFDSAVIQNLVDSPQLNLDFDITAISLTGFDVLFNGQADTNNYYFRWRVAVPPV